ncbi:MAG: elongation factor P maturation arginine rhamnosyltransferase EarP [Betaproteobacteria bacterium]
MNLPLNWDLFCKVIDNLGDVGVCWRLAADLAARGQRVRLWCDDPAPLAWMAPGGAPGVQVFPWRDPLPAESPGDVVIEAFACDPPAAFVQAMAAKAVPPVWVNLEYLSAEPWVERCHALPSPQSTGPGAGLKKWFFHPGFTPATGGLIREPSLDQAQARFDRGHWLRHLGLELRGGERLAVLFCYDNLALPELLRLLGDQPTLLALTPGPAQAQVHRLALPAGVRTHDLPWLSQPEFDRLLWSADLNLVRGEDSLVRAVWAGRPFLWQLYPQEDGAHLVKSAAFLDHWLGGGLPAEQEPWKTGLRQLWDRWNQAGLSAPGQVTAGATLVLPDATAWAAAVQALRRGLLAQDDLTTQLMRFVVARGPASPAAAAVNS